MVYVIKFTECGTDPGLHYFSFFSHVGLEKVNCASADVKQVIFLSTGRNMYFWIIRIQVLLGYHVADPKLHNLRAAEKRTRIFYIIN